MNDFELQHLPEAYRPLSPWTYFGLGILYSLPLVGCGKLRQPHIFKQARNINCRCAAVLQIVLIGRNKCVGYGVLHVFQLFGRDSHPLCDVIQRLIDGQSGFARAPEAKSLAGALSVLHFCYKNHSHSLVAF